jgi:hypothetical protein
MFSFDAIAIELAGGRDVPMPRSPLGWTNANIPGSSIMCCAEAGDPISTDRKAAAPKNRVLVILLLLIIDPSTWAVGEQDRHFGDNIPGQNQSADHASAIRI